MQLLKAEDIKEESTKSIFEMNQPFLDQYFESIRKKAYALRHNYFDDMDKHLLNLESSLMRKGLNVLWIKDKND